MVAPDRAGGTFESTAEMLRQVVTCSFPDGPDGDDALIYHFAMRVQTALDRPWSEFCAAQPFPAHDADPAELRRQLMASDWWRAEEPRRWISKAYGRIKRLCETRGIDARPLLWLRRHIRGEFEASREDQRAIRDMLDMLVDSSEILPPPVNVSSETSRSHPNTVSQEHSAEATFSPAGLARELKISPKTLNKWMKEDGLPTPGKGRKDFAYLLSNALIMCDSKLRSGDRASLKCCSDFLKRWRPK